MTPEPVPGDVEGIVAAFSADQLVVNDVPDERTAALRLRCRQVVAEALDGAVTAAGVRCSPLGPEWTSAFEVTVTGGAGAGAAVPAGWLPLDRLLPAEPAGSPSLGTWAVVEHGTVLGGVRLLRQAPAPGPLDRLLVSCHGTRRVGLRDVLELRELRRAGYDLPPSSDVLTVAADIESGLGGRVLAPWATGRAVRAPARLRGPRRGPRRLVVSVSGVDGSGKTTLRTALEAELRRAGVHVSTVWVRPGMGLGPLVRVATWAKRALGQAPTPGIRAMGGPGHGAAGLRSRRGLVGWVWALLVCGSFVTGVWRQHADAEGVVLYDRHVVDALATLDFAYEGVDLRLHRALVRALLPRADVALYLDVTAEVSVARKPDDVFGAGAVTRQLTAYDSWLRLFPAVHRLDATRPAPELVEAALRLIVGAPAADATASPTGVR